MGDVIPFPIDNIRQLNIQTEELVGSTAALERDTSRALKLAEALCTDVISVNFGFTEPDYDSPA